MKKFQVIILSFFIASLMACGNPQKTWEDNGKKIDQLAKDGKLKEALELAKENTTLAKDEFGKNDVRVAKSLIIIGSLQLLTGSPDYAEITFTRVLEMTQKVDEAWDPIGATTMRRLGEIYKKQNKTAEAMNLIQRALELDKKSAKEMNLNNADDLQQLSESYLAQGQLTEAENLAKQALSIRKAKLDENNPMMASIYNQLAIIYVRQNKLEDAKSLFSLALQIWRKAYGPDYLQSGVILYNLGLLDEKNNQLAGAKKNLEEALAIHQKHLKVEHPDVQRVIKSLVKLYQKLNLGVQASELSAKLIEDSK